MMDTLLVLNAGSSSLKFSLFHDADSPVLTLHGQLEGLQTEPRFIARDATGSIVGEHSWAAGAKLSHNDAITFLFNWRHRYRTDAFRIVGVGHRVVHGGTRFLKPERIDDRVLAELDLLVPLAPLHQPHNISAIRAVARQLPNVPQIACFDTSFHQTQPRIAREFAIPRDLTASGIQRYGFHGLSYEYIASQLPEVDSRAATGRTVVAHLGNGASLCALKGGISIATTMGFTPLDGLMMGTRCGAIDPGVLLYLIEQRGMDSHAVQRLLTNESGLLGVSGISSDMRTLLQNEATDPRAAHAIELFVYRMSRELGSMAAALGGLDALVFTGGIGENAAAIRDRVCHLVGWLGVHVDRAANERGESRISSATSSVAIWIVPTDEELMIAKHIKSLLKPRN
jgi:acetate kinase